MNEKLSSNESPRVELVGGEEVEVQPASLPQVVAEQSWPAHATPTARLASDLRLPLDAVHRIISDLSAEVDRAAPDGDPILIVQHATEAMERYARELPAAEQALTDCYIDSLPRRDLLIMAYRKCGKRSREIARLMRMPVTAVQCSMARTLLGLHSLSLPPAPHPAGGGDLALEFERGSNSCAAMIPADLASSPAGRLMRGLKLMSLLSFFAVSMLLTGCDTVSEYRELKDRMFYMSGGVGLGRSDANGAMKVLRNSQVAATGLPPIRFSDDDTRGNDGFQFTLGYRLNKYFEAEAGWTGLGGKMSYTHDGLLADPVRRIRTRHEGEFKEREFFLTVLPRWELNEVLALHARLGAGYSRSAMNAKLWAGECCEHLAFENYVRHNTKGASRVFGLGFSISQTLWVEYLTRRVPVASTGELRASDGFTTISAPGINDTLKLTTWQISFRRPFGGGGTSDH